MLSKLSASVANRVRRARGQEEVAIADVGQPLSMVYSTKRKKWVNRGEEDLSEPEAEQLAPPPMASSSSAAPPAPAADAPPAVPKTGADALISAPAYHGFRRTPAKAKAAAPPGGMVAAPFPGPAAIAAPFGVPPPREVADPDQDAAPLAGPPQEAPGPFRPRATVENVAEATAKAREERKAAAEARRSQRKAPAPVTAMPGPFGMPAANPFIGAPSADDADPEGPAAEREEAPERSATAANGHGADLHAGMEGPAVPAEEPAAGLAPTATETAALLQEELSRPVAHAEEEPRAAEEATTQAVASAIIRSRPAPTNPQEPEAEGADDYKRMPIDTLMNKLLDKWESTEDVRKISEALELRGYEVENRYKMAEHQGIGLFMKVLTYHAGASEELLRPLVSTITTLMLCTDLASEFIEAGLLSVTNDLLLRDGIKKVQGLLITAMTCAATKVPDDEKIQLLRKLETVEADTDRLGYLLYTYGLRAKDQTVKALVRSLGARLPGHWGPMLQQAASF